MIVHRRKWCYRLAGQNFAHVVQFKLPVTAEFVRAALQRTLGTQPVELWGR